MSEGSATTTAVSSFGIVRGGAERALHCKTWRCIVPGGPQSTLSVGPEVKRGIPGKQSGSQKMGCVPRDEEHAMESGQFVRGGLKCKQ